MHEFFQQLEEQRQEAARRAFERGVAEGLYQNTEVAWRAFSEGWWSKVRFEHDLRTEREAGTNANMLSFLAITIGLIAIAIPVMAYMTAPLGAINISRCWMIAAAGVGLLATSFPLRRASKKQAKEAREIFTNKWQRHLQ